MRACRIAPVAPRYPLRKVRHYLIGMKKGKGVKPKNRGNGCATECCRGALRASPHETVEKIPSALFPFRHPGGRIPCASQRLRRFFAVSRLRCSSHPGCRSVLNDCSAPKRRTYPGPREVKGGIHKSSKSRAFTNLPPLDFPKSRAGVLIGRGTAIRTDQQPQGAAP